MKKRFLSLVLSVIMIISLIPTFVLAQESNELKRYIVLVLDTSGNSDFVDSNNKVFYTSTSEIEYVKQAALNFSQEILNDDRNYIAIVSFRNNAEITSEFTNNFETLKQKINSLYAYGETRNISSGLKKANELIDSVIDISSEKNVVIFSTGFSNDGSYNYQGRYGKETIAGNWNRIDTNIPIYAYSNVAFAEAEILKEKASVYSLGFFKNINNIPIYSNSREVPEFFKLVAKDLASSEDYFIEVDDPNNIEIAFGNLANILKDGFELYSNRPNLTITEGESLEISARYKESNVVQGMEFGVSCSIENDDIAYIADTSVPGDELIVKIRGKKAGRTTFKITDTNRGYVTTADITVTPKYNNVYTIHNIPRQDLYEGSLFGKDYYTEDNNFAFSDLYIDSFSKTINDVNSCSMSFDVYNANYSYGIVEVYDENSKIIDAVLIDNYEDKNESIKEVIIDGTGRLIKQSKVGFSYQSPIITQQTSVKIENVPSGGYIRITANSSESPLLCIINEAAIVLNAMEFGGKITDLSKKQYDSVLPKFLDRVIDTYIQNPPPSFKKAASENLLKGITKKTLISTESVSNFAESIVNNLNEIKWEELFVEVVEESGFSVAEDAFISLAGPAGTALKACFSIGSGGNLICSCVDFVGLLEDPVISIQVPDNYTRTYNKVRIQSPSPIDKDVAIETYMIEGKELRNWPEFLRKKEEAGEYVEYINISLIKNGEETQIGTDVEVSIPLTHAMQEYYGDIKVYRVEADGSLTDMNAYQNIWGTESYITFRTDHFSIYAIVAENDADTGGQDSKSNIDDMFGGVSDWARAEIEEAVEKKLIPSALVFTDLRENINRKEFAALSVKLYESVTGKDAEYSNAPFTDISEYDTEIKKAYSLGITTGTSETTFEPGTLISREQLATMLCRVFKKYAWDGWNIDNDYFYSLNYSGVSKFADDDKISEYAKPSVYFMAKHKIINGVGNNKFAPKTDTTDGFATREQAILMALRCYNNLFNDEVINNSQIYPQSICGDNLSYVFDGNTLTISGNGYMYDFYATVNAIVGEKKRPWNGDGIKKVVIEKGVKSIGAYAFYDCEQLTEVVIESDIESIGDYAFGRCENLKNVQLPDSVKIIGESSFADCSNLTQIIIPDNVVSIQDNAFYRCSSLKKVVLGKELKEIGERAFIYCSGLTSITLHDKIDVICEGAFSDCDLLTDVTYVGNESNTKTLFEENRKTEELVFTRTEGSYGENATWKLENDTLIVSGKGKLVWDKINADILRKINAKNLVIESGITEIGESYFWSNQSFEKVVLPNTLEKLGIYTFRGCKNIKEVVFPDTEFTIDGGCFEGCINLTHIYLPEKAKLVGLMPFGEIAYGNPDRIDITFYTSENSPAYNWAKNNGFAVVVSTRNEFEKIQK